MKKAVCILSPSMLFRAILLSALIWFHSCEPSADDMAGGEVCRVSFDPSESETIVTDLLDTAEISVDIALYGFENERIADSLISAARRGVKIRCVTEYDSESSVSWQRMIAESRDNPDASIGVVLGNASGIMHNKYFIVDRRYVITGSTNLTGGMFRHYNNMVLIKSRGLAADFMLDFEVLYAGFNASKKGNDPTKSADRNGFNELFGDGLSFPETAYEIGGMQVRAYFTPYRALFESYRSDNPVEYIYFDNEIDSYSAESYANAMNVILPLLQEADESIWIYSYSLTDKVLMDVLSKACSRGVSVRVYMDYSQFNSSLCHSGRSILALARRCGDVYLCRRPDGGLLHHKVIIVDGKTLVTGSLNFSSNAVSDNDENFLVFRNAQNLARAFAEEGGRIEQSSFKLSLSEDQIDRLQNECGEGNRPEKVLTAGCRK